MERAAGHEVLLFEPTTAAAVRWGGAELPSLSAVAIVRASMNDMLHSALMC